jgi:phosphate acetyltransferase
MRLFAHRGAEANQYYNPYKDGTGKCLRPCWRRSGCKAKSLGRKICLTESDDPRNIAAAAKLVQTGYAKPVLVGDEAAMVKLAKENGIDLKGVELVDVSKYAKFEQYVAMVVEMRKSKGLTEEQARAWLKDTCVFSAAMVCAGDAHGYVSASANPRATTTTPRPRPVRPSSSSRRPPA